MSHRIAVALLVGFIALPCTSLVSRADDSQASAEKKECCNKDGKCTKCKCENCENESCDKENCTCNKESTAASLGAEKDCKSCDEAGRKCPGVTNVAYSETGCKEGKCSGCKCAGDKCAGKKCCSEGSCNHKCCADDESVACTQTFEFPIGEQSLFGYASPWEASAVRDAVWQHMASDQPICSRGAADCAECDEQVRVRLASTSESEVAPHPYIVRAAVPQIDDHQERSQRGANDGPVHIQYSIQIIEDCRGCLEEYDALRKGAPMMFGESKSLLPAIRLLAKNDLVKQTSSPKVICTAGQTAVLAIESANGDGVEGVRLEVAGEEAENGLRVELAMHASDSDRNVGVRTALLVAHGQTIVLNANTSPNQDDTDEENPAVYIVVTPEVVE